jgi:type II secretory pathway component PulJ
MIPRRCREEVSHDGGTTLVELVITLGLLMMMLLAVLSLLDSGTRTERAQQARGDAITGARQTVDRVSKDVRQATAVNADSTQSSLDIQTLIAGSPTRVVYDVSGGNFRRTVCAGFAFTSACDGNAAVMATRVSPPEVFCYDYDPQTGCLEDSGLHPRTSPLPTSIRVDISVQPEVFSGGPIRLATDVELRNL